MRECTSRCKSHWDPATGGAAHLLLTGHHVASGPPDTTQSPFPARKMASPGVGSILRILQINSQIIDNYCFQLASRVPINHESNGKIHTKSFYS